VRLLLRERTHGVWWTHRISPIIHFLPDSHKQLGIRLACGTLSNTALCTTDSDEVSCRKCRGTSEFLQESAA